MIQPISGQMYRPMPRPMYNAVNIEIHAPQTNMTSPMEYVMPPKYPQDEGVYACPRQSVYDVPKVSVYDSKAENRVIPQQTLVTNPIKKDVVTEPVAVSQNTPAESKAPVKEVKTEVPVEVSKTVAEPKKIDIIKPENLEPVIDINTFIAELVSPNYERQAEAMNVIAQVSAAAPDIASQLLDVKVIDTLLGIMTRDTSNLEVPSQAQLMYREAIMNGGQVPPEQRAAAMAKAPVEKAEENKAYAMYTLATMQKVYGSEVEKMGGNVVPLKELPGAKEIIKEVEANPNPHVKVAGLNALNYVRRPEYNADLQVIYQKAMQDENPMVRNTAQKAILLIG